MREIKFRAWDKDDKKMWKVVGFSEPIWGDCEETHVTICDFDKSPLEKETDVRASFNYELMQFTGSVDKNGVEIYEGDIVKCWDNSIVKVMWNNSYNGFYLAHSFYHRRLESDLREGIEVIGNIYENSDLLATV